MYYGEKNGISMTGGSGNGRRPIVPPEPDPGRVPRRRKKSGVAAGILIGLIVAAMFLCAAVGLLARMGVTLPSLGSRTGEPSAGIRDALIQEAVESYLLSGENPMRSLNAGSDYRIVRCERDLGMMLVTIAVTQKTEKTFYECELQTKWKRDGIDYTLIYLSPSRDVVCYPRNAPGKDAEQALLKRFERKYPGARFRFDFSQWREKDGSFVAGFVIAEPNLVYTKEQSAQITLNWSVPEEEWQTDDFTFRVLEKSIDLSGLEGTWTGDYYHFSNYLSEDYIPFSLTFSDVGRIVLDSTGKGDTTLTVQHTLNDLWNTYQTKDYDVHYESGQMRIFMTDYGYCRIEFEETNIEGIFKHPCTLNIHSDRIQFEDALVAQSVTLQKSE